MPCRDLAAAVEAAGLQEDAGARLLGELGAGRGQVWRLARLKLA